MRATAIAACLYALFMELHMHEKDHDGPALLVQRSRSWRLETGDCPRGGEESRLPFRLGDGGLPLITATPWTTLPVSALFLSGASRPPLFLLP